MPSSTLLVIAVTLAAATASAQADAGMREQPIDEVAADLAYGYCPLYLAGRFSLAAPELAERGFDAQIEKAPHPRVGEMSIVSARRPDGEIAFGGAPGKACTVAVAGPRRDAVMARLRTSMSFMGLDFRPSANPGPALPGVAVETFAAPVDAQMLYVQLVRTGGTKPTVAAQLFAMDK